MKRKFRVAAFSGIAIATLGLITYLFVSNDLVLLQPKGTIADQQKNLLVFAALLSLVVLVPVFLLTFFISIRYREKNKKAKYTPDHDHNRTLETIWWGIPIAIILLLSVITWKTSHSLDPYRPLSSDKKPLTIQVVALQWKWLFIYPEQKIATVNYFQIPEDTPVNFKITADAPMNSFWVPKLGGQVYAMSGMETKLHLMADNPGKYDGYSANISGEGFADMKFVAESVLEEEFNSWVEKTKLSTEILDSNSYEDLASPQTEVKAAAFALADETLFSTIINKYMSHTSHLENSKTEDANHDHSSHEGGSH